MTALNCPSQFNLKNTTCEYTCKAGTSEQFIAGKQDITLQSKCKQLLKKQNKPVFGVGDQDFTLKLLAIER